MLEVLRRAGASPLPAHRFLRGCVRIAMAVSASPSDDSFDRTVYPASADRDEVLVEAVRELQLATTLQHQRAALAIASLATVACGPHAARHLAVVLPAVLPCATESADAGTAALAMRTLRSIAVSCWPRVRDNTELRGSLLAAALVVASRVPVLFDSIPSDEEHPASAPASTTGLELTAAQAGVARECALALVVVAGACSTDDFVEAWRAMDSKGRDDDDRLTTPVLSALRRAFIHK